MFARRHLILLVALCLSVAVISAPTVESNDHTVIRELDNVKFNDFERREPLGNIGTIKGGSSSGSTKGVKQPSSPSTQNTAATVTPPTGATCSVSNSKTSPVTKTPSSTKKISRAIGWLFGRAYDDDNVHSLIARAAPKRTGDRIVINRNTYTLGRQITTGSRGSGVSITFETTNIDGRPAIAKQLIRDDQRNQFSDEIKRTDAAGKAQGNHLYLDSGCSADGAMWLIMTRVDGRDIHNILLALRPATKAQCETYLELAAQTAATAQTILATRTGFVQGDDNYENYLFSPDLSKVDIIDFGVVYPAGTNPQANTIYQSQLRSMRAADGTFGNQWC